MFFKNASIKGNIKNKMIIMKTGIIEMRSALESIKTPLSGEIQDDVKACMGDSVRESYLGQCNEMVDDVKKIIDVCNQMIAELESNISAVDKVEVYVLDRLSMFNKGSYCTEVITSENTKENQEVRIVQCNYKVTKTDSSQFSSSKPKEYPGVDVTITGYDSQKFGIINMDGALKLLVGGRA